MPIPGILILTLPVNFYGSSYDFQVFSWSWSNSLSLATSLKKHLLKAEVVGFSARTLEPFYRILPCWNALVWESCDSLSRELLIFNANKLLPINTFNRSHKLIVYNLQWTEFFQTGVYNVAIPLNIYCFVSLKPSQIVELKQISLFIIRQIRHKVLMTLLGV